MTTNIIIAVVTAYCHCKLCCGTTGQLTASGRQPQVARTIAVPRSVKLGSTIIIASHSYVAEDRTARRYDGRFDVFMASHKEALKFGIKTNKVTIVSPCSFSLPFCGQ
jgi:3D (Asp-Asp-Asp) domain-containing protein